MSKIEDKKLRKIPIEIVGNINSYSIKDTDTRFTEVLIKVLHTGKNFNGSIFKKEVVEKALPTMKNTPILAFIEKNSENEDDFSDHRMTLEVENGKTKLVYKCQPIGVIPESFVDEAYFSTEICSDGIEREFLFVKGLLWNKLEKPLEIMNRNNGSNQSMELSDNYKGHFEDNGFVFDEFEFYGCTALGKDVKPAMIDSRIEVDFSANSYNIAKEIENKLKQFEKLIQSKKEGIKKEMANKKIQEVLETVETDNVCKEKVPTNNIKENVKEVEDIETSNACGKDSKTKNEKEEKIESNEDKEFKEVEEPKTKEYSIKFSLPYEDIKRKIYDKLFDMSLNSDEPSAYYIVKTLDEKFIYQNCYDDKFYGQSYRVIDDEVEFIGAREELFNIFVSETDYNYIKENSLSYYISLSNKLKEVNEKLNDFEKENKKLKDFKLRVDVDNVLSKFSKYDGLDIEEFRNKVHNGEIKLESLEDEIYKEIGKNNFSMKRNENSMLNHKLSFEEEKDVCPYSSLVEYFK